jgi:hypothetical protein
MKSACSFQFDGGKEPLDRCQWSQLADLHAACGHDAELAVWLRGRWTESGLGLVETMQRRLFNCAIINNTGQTPFKYLEWD